MSYFDVSFAKPYAQSTNTFSFIEGLKLLIELVTKRTSGSVTPTMPAAYIMAFT
jgi:hypothetical protein